MTCMDRRTLEKYNFQVPRYTSYPPATRFFPVADAATDIRAWYETAPADISLYIHIPFCARLCHYCGCNMRVVNTYHPVTEYLDCLKKEILQVRKVLPQKHNVSHIHFGGGSPTILCPMDFRRMVAFLKDNFTVDESAEISVEADPRNISEGKIAAYAMSGVSRMSLGVQDFNQEVLRLINRPQPFNLTYHAVQLCRGYGINNINFDLMYGLPAQTADTIARTMELALSLRPDRIAYFGYAHVPWMKRHMTLMPEDRLPDVHGRYDLQETGARLISQAGYVPVGIDHFVWPEDSMAKVLQNRRLYRNFQGYTTDAAPTLIGLGSSSISAFRQGYAQNDPNLKNYMDTVKSGKSAVHKILPFDTKDLPVKKIIEEIMCYMRVDLKEICRGFGLSENHFFSEIVALQNLEQDGIVRVRGDVVEVDPDRRVLARVVCEVFDAYAKVQSGLQRHAMAV